MNSAASSPVCPLCGGERVAGNVTFSAELGTGVIVVRNVPASVCEQCGEEWIADDIAAQIEERARDARDRGAEVEVVAL